MGYASISDPTIWYIYFVTISNLPKSCRLPPNFVTGHICDACRVPSKKATGFLTEAIVPLTGPLGAPTLPP